MRSVFHSFIFLLADRKTSSPEIILAKVLIYIVSIAVNVAILASGVVLISCSVLFCFFFIFIWRKCLYIQLDLFNLELIETVPPPVLFVETECGVHAHCTPTNKKRIHFETFLFASLSYLSKAKNE